MTLLQFLHDASFWQWAGLLLLVSTSFFGVALVSELTLKGVANVVRAFRSR